MKMYVCDLLKASKNSLRSPDNPIIFKGFLKDTLTSWVEKIGADQSEEARSFHGSPFAAGAVW